MLLILSHPQTFQFHPVNGNPPGPRPTNYASPFLHRRTSESVKSRKSPHRIFPNIPLAKLHYRDSFFITRQCEVRSGPSLSSSYLSYETYSTHPLFIYFLLHQLLVIFFPYICDLHTPWAQPLVVYVAPLHSYHQVLCPQILFVLGMCWLYTI